MGNTSLLDDANKSLADQKIKVHQFEFRTGNAEFAKWRDRKAADL